MLFEVYPIVEGEAEVAALPILLRRMLDERGTPNIRVLKPHRMPKGRMRKPRELANAITLARYKIQDRGIALVLLDSDDDCPVELAAELQEHISVPISLLPSTVVVAVREFEAWFLAAAQSLRSHRKVRPDAEPPPDPEQIRGAKEYLETRILRAQETYAATVDQPSFAAMISLELASTSRSFRKLAKEIDRICVAAQYDAT